MADNITLNSGSGGDTLAADDVSSVWYQRVKLTDGTADSATPIESGNGTSTGALRVTVASDSTGLMSVDDNGGSLTVDNADITTIAGAVSGTEMQVDAVSVIPGTGPTNLGKAIDTAVGGTDTGVAMLAKHKEDQVHLTTADDDYDVLGLDSLGSLHVNAEAHHIFDELDATTGWTALGNDTLNLATTTKHVMGTAALTFDKVNGAANTVFAGIQKTLSSTDLGDVSPHDILQGSFYIPDLTDVSYIFLRLGTDSSNYNEWRLDASLLTAGVFETGALTIGDADYGGITGNGMNSSAITYMAVGVAFNAETDTLAGIIFDQISYHTNQHTSTSINSEVSSSVSSANVNVSKVGGKVTNTQAGNVATGTQRVTIATDDANLSAIKTSVELIDNAISGTEMQVDVVAALPAGTNAIGKLAANSGVDIGDVDVTSIAAGTNLVGDVGISGARTSGGTTLYRNIDVDESEDQVKGSAGQLYWVHAMNLTASVLYLQVYNALATSVTVGTTTPDLTFALATQGDTNGAGFTLSIPNGIALGTGITIACTTTVGGAAGPAANGCLVNLGYA